MNVIKYKAKKDYYLGQGITLKGPETKKYKLLGILENKCDNVCKFTTQPDRLRSVKTINSDPEFARWEDNDIEF